MKNLGFFCALLAPSMLLAEIVPLEMFFQDEPFCTEKKTKTLEKKESAPVCCTSNSFVTLGGNYSRLNFKADGSRSLNGNLGGAHAMYEWRPQNSFYAALGFKWRQGTMHHSGHRRSLVDLDSAERVGYNLQGDWGHCSFYTGLGFRFLSHHLHASGNSTFNGSFFPPFLTSATSLQINYYELYVPVGFASQYNFNSCFALGVNFEWMPQVFPTVQIRPMGGAFWSLTNKIANFNIELPFIFTLTQCRSLSLVLSPFYQRWEDGHSTARTSRGTPLGLPGNTYNFFGADLNLIYKF